MDGTETIDGVYGELRDYFDHFPAGLPAVEDGLDQQVLKHLFTPEEARLMLKMRQALEPAGAIARRAHWPEKDVKEVLDVMADKNLIWRVSLGGRTLFMPVQFVVGMLEESVLKELAQDAADEELLEMLGADELLEITRRIWSGTATKQLRVVPVNAAIDAAPAVAQYDRIRDAVRQQETISVMNCFCREIKGACGEECRRSHESCIAFGAAAEHMIESGISRRITVEEALEILDRAEEEALVLQPNNALEPVYICCCCGCCCGILRTLRKMERPADQVHSSFQARIEPWLCTACGTCEGRCQMGAISGNGDSMEVDPARCIGCGLCVSTCIENAVAMVPRPGAEEPPLTYMDTITRMAGERGLPLGKSNSLVRKTSFSKYLKTWDYLYRLHLARPVIGMMARRGMV